MFSSWMSRFAVPLLSATLGLAACSAPSAAPLATPPAAVGSSPAPAISPAQGHLTVYGALTDANGKALSAAFQQAQQGVPVDIVAAGTGPLVSRIESERRAGGVMADVILLADPTVMPPLQAEGVLSPYIPSGAANLAPGLKGEGWVGAFTFNNVIVSRKDGSQPADWADLLKPEFKNAVMLGDPAYSGTTLGMVGYLSQTLGWDYFTKLRENGATTVQSTNTVGTDVAKGSVQAGITLDSVVRDLVTKGSPVQIIWPTSGAIPVPAPAAIVKGHESPASQAFVDWLLSPSGQQALVKFGYAPALGASNAVPASAKLVNVDWPTIGGQRDQILQHFKQIFA